MPIQRMISALSGAKASAPVNDRIAASAFPDCDSFCPRFNNRAAIGESGSDVVAIGVMLQRASFRHRVLSPTIMPTLASSRSKKPPGTSPGGGE
ncbi:MAG TPA: hypothetical protein VFI81_11530 [Rhodanobacteraceae bacterium]|nr:hypothetical protein [Rhodanobacteraceae bacterium]